MLTASRSAGVTFAPVVGVAPATTTMMLPATVMHQRARAHERAAGVRAQPVVIRRAAPHGGFYMPYGTIEDLRGGRAWSDAAPSTAPDLQTQVQQLAVQQAKLQTTMTVIGIGLAISTAISVITAIGHAFSKK